jgi:hypothetical protein
MERLQRERRYSREAALETFLYGGHLHEASANIRFRRWISQHRQFAQFFVRDGRDNDQIMPISKTYIFS